MVGGIVDGATSRYSTQVKTGGCSRQATERELDQALEFDPPIATKGVMREGKCQILCTVDNLQTITS